MGDLLLINNCVIYDKNKAILYRLDEPDSPASLTNPGNQCLSILLNSNHNLIPKEFFFQEVWLSKDLPITSNTFHQHIYMLRRILSDLGLPKDMLTTIPREGVQLSQSVYIQAYSDPNALKPEDTSASQYKMATEASDDLKMERKRRHDPKKIKTLLIISMVMLIIYFVALWLSLSIYRSNDYSDNFTFRGIMKNCEIYSSPGSISMKYIINDVNKLTYSCDARSKGKIYYITKLPNPGKSIIFCPDEMKSTNAHNCKSLYVIEKNHDEL
ncbi:winged helix-turn-helix domain-containing protein [Pragia fontium]|uniref:winged helix-turn-helix domain-containing protein n=1 Tax=Pragia fontium TaxID=82985 RepID=UPI00064A59CB|nr:winged helix-turn-helix domain-containing protein [Pragia fontium]AKJ41697.1 hypothetical protein QQ39_06050 [Pragia fontium]